jgi:hypothetical protein
MSSRNLLILAAAAVALLLYLRRKSGAGSSLTTTGTGQPIPQLLRPPGQIHFGPGPGPVWW